MFPAASWIAPSTKICTMVLKSYQVTLFLKVIPSFKSCNVKHLLNSPPPPPKSVSLAALTIASISNLVISPTYKLTLDASFEVCAEFVFESSGWYFVNCSRSWSETEFEIKVLQLRHAKLIGKKKITNGEFNFLSRISHLPFSIRFLLLFV